VEAGPSAAAWTARDGGGALPERGPRPTRSPAQQGRPPVASAGAADQALRHVTQPACAGPRRRRPAACWQSSSQANQSRNSGAAARPSIRARGGHALNTPAAGPLPRPPSHKARGASHDSALHAPSQHLLATARRENSSAHKDVVFGTTRPARRGAPASPRRARRPAPARGRRGPALREWQAAGAAPRAGRRDAGPGDAARARLGRPAVQASLRCTTPTPSPPPPWCSSPSSRAAGRRPARPPAAPSV